MQIRVEEEVVLVSTQWNHCEKVQYVDSFRSLNWISQFPELNSFPFTNSLDLFVFDVPFANCLATWPKIAIKQLHVVFAINTLNEKLHPSLTSAIDTVFKIAFVCFYKFIAWPFVDPYFFFRVLHESLYGYMATSDIANMENGNLNQHQPNGNAAAIGSPANFVDPDLAMALRISEQEQKQLQEQLQREAEELEEVLRLSINDK